MRIYWLMDDHRMYRHIANEMPLLKAEVAKEAEAIGERARARLQQISYEGNAKIEVSHEERSLEYGRIDSFVWLVDEPHMHTKGPKAGQWSEGNAMSIEFGRIHNWTGKYIPGNYIVTGAAGLA